MANLSEVLRKIEELPPDKLQDVADYVEAIRTPIGNEASGATGAPRSFSDGPFVGMWGNRPDMDDSARWVRELRETEWAPIRADEHP